MFSILRSTSSSVGAVLVTERIFSDVERDAYTIVGGILGFWADFERGVDGFIKWIERAPREISWPLDYTDLNAFRGFKERKGLLRKLVSINGLKQDVSALDKIFQVFAVVKSVRHDFAHESFHARLPSSSTDELRTLTADDIVFDIYRNRDRSQVRYVGRELKQHLRRMKDANHKLLFLQWTIVDRIRNNI